MDKSRQRKHTGIKSRLNIYRETIVFLASSVLWLYCLMVLFVVVGSILPVQNHFIQLVRVILNIEKSDIMTILSYFGIGSVIIIIYFLLAFNINSKRKRALPHEQA